jgi:hypothetical protein
MIELSLEDRGQRLEAVNEHTIKQNPTMPSIAKELQRQQ